MIPQFTASAALAASAPAHRQTARYHPAVARVSLQQRVATQPSDAMANAFGTTAVMTCPGCWTYTCGFLGWSTCLMCCG